MSNPIVNYFSDFKILKTASKEFWLNSVWPSTATATVWASSPKTARTFTPTAR